MRVIGTILRIGMSAIIAIVALGEVALASTTAPADIRFHGGVGSAPVTVSGLLNRAGDSPKVGYWIDLSRQPEAAVQSDDHVVEKSTKVFELLVTISLPGFANESLRIKHMTNGAELAGSECEVSAQDTERINKGPAFKLNAVVDQSAKSASGAKTCLVDIWVTADPSLMPYREVQVRTMETLHKMGEIQNAKEPQFLCRAIGGPLADAVTVVGERLRSLSSLALPEVDQQVWNSTEQARIFIKAADMNCQSNPARVDEAFLNEIRSAIHQAQLELNAAAQAMVFW